MALKSPQTPKSIKNPINPYKNPKNAHGPEDGMRQRAPQPWAALARRGFRRALRDPGGAARTEGFKGSGVSLRGLRGLGFLGFRGFFKGIKGLRALGFKGFGFWVFFWFLEGLSFRVLVVFGFL